MNYFTNYCSTVLNALLPQRCALCEQTTGTASPVCGSCLHTMKALPDQHCPRCADFSATATLCGRCLSAPPAFDRVLSPFLYASPTDRLIQSLKYQHHLRLASWLGQCLLGCLENHNTLLNDTDALIPLPLHPSRMKTRGFNQAIEIARPIAASTHLPLLHNAVFRVRDTGPQARLSRSDRQQNIAGAFECRADFSGKSLLIIDDVLTTGASSHELARVLKLHGARQVVIAVAARAYQA